MLNKEQILDKLKELELDNDEFVVSMGSSLVLHGIKKETNNINISDISDVSEKSHNRDIKIMKTTVSSRCGQAGLNLRAYHARL